MQQSQAAEGIASLKPPGTVPTLGKNAPYSGMVVRIAAGRRPGVDFADLWAYRELLYFLAWRDVKLRYKQTLLGAAWAILQPVATMVVFTLLFGKLARIPSEGVPYPIFVYAGLLPWTFFANAVTASGDSLVANSTLLTKVYFPRMLIPGAAVAAGLVDFAISAGVLSAMMLYYAVRASAHLLMLAPLVVFTALLALAFGMWIAALNVKYRDVRYAIPFAMQLWMFVTPVIYPVTIVPPRWRPVLFMNPLSGLIQGYRCALLGREFEWTALLASAILTLTVLAYSVHMFGRMERSFADVV